MADVDANTARPDGKLQETAGKSEVLPQPAGLQGEARMRVADTLAGTPVLSADEVQKLWQAAVMSESALRLQMTLNQWALRKNVPAERLLQELRMFAKNRIREREKGPLRHFHRTSWEALPIIAKSGQFLSRPLIKERHPEVQLAGWSSSDDVMFTRDKYDKNGTLIMAGLRGKEVVGASGSGAIFVMKESMMDAPDYDATRQFPTVTEIDMTPHCECLLVANAADETRLRNIIKNTSLENVPVRVRNEWEQENGREDLR